MGFVKNAFRSIGRIFKAALPILGAIGGSMIGAPHLGAALGGAIGGYMGGGGWSGALRGGVMSGLGSWAGGSAFNSIGGQIGRNSLTIANAIGGTATGALQSVFTTAVGSAIGAGVGGLAHDNMARQERRMRAEMEAAQREQDAAWNTATFNLGLGNAANSGIGAAAIESAPAVNDAFQRMDNDMAEDRGRRGANGRWSAFNRTAGNIGAGGFDYVQTRRRVFSRAVTG